MRAVENKSILLLDLGEMKRGRCLECSDACRRACAVWPVSRDTIRNCTLVRRLFRSAGNGDARGDVHGLMYVVPFNIKLYVISTVESKHRREAKTEPRTAPF